MVRGLLPGKDCGGAAVPNGKLERRISRLNGRETRVMAKMEGDSGGGGVSEGREPDHFDWLNFNAEEVCFV
jgi:hypothetical protein